MNTFSFNITLYPLYIPLILLLFVGNFTPGPNNIIASYSGFHFGFKKTIPHILGVTFGWPSLILAVNFGLVIIFIEFPIVQRTVEILGSLFLIYLAYTLIKVKSIEEKEVQKPMTFLASYFFQFINPKGVVTAIIVVSQFIDSGENFFKIRFVVLSFTLISAFLSICTWTIFGKYLRSLLSSKLSISLFNYSMASLLVLIVVLFWIK
jgi:threonine/homoserine/homoserine lactone efflux protein